MIHTQADMLALADALDAIIPLGGNFVPQQKAATLLREIAQAEPVADEQKAAQDDAYVCGRNDERKAIAQWLEGQGQPGYAHDVRYRQGIKEQP